MMLTSAVYWQDSDDMHRNTRHNTMNIVKHVTMWYASWYTRHDMM